MLQQRLVAIPDLLVLLLRELLVPAFLLLRLPRSLDDRRRDAVQVALPVLADPPAAVRRLLEHADLLQGLAHLALHGRRGVPVVRRPVAAPVAPAVQLREGADADVPAEVDVARDGGCGRGRSESVRRARGRRTAHLRGRRTSRGRTARAPCTRPSSRCRPTSAPRVFRSV